MAGAHRSGRSRQRVVQEAASTNERVEVTNTKDTAHGPVRRPPKSKHGGKTNRGNA